MDSEQIKELVESWGQYTTFLKTKYPPKEGQEFAFTCEHHQRIDQIIQKIQTEGVCRCGCKGEAEHTCPFSSEINGDDTTLCNCCEECTYQCAMDI